MKNKIYKLLSIVLSIMIVFSCCTVAFTAFAEEVAEEDIIATYYISATGSDETGTGEQATPFLSVGKAITQATTDGHNVAGNTVAIHVTNETADTSVNMIGSLSAANCDLIIYADAARTVLYNSSGGIAFSGTGSLTFKNIYLYAKSYANISFGNKNVSFDSGSRLAPGVWGGYTSLGLFNTNSSTTTPLYFTMNGVSEPIYLCDPQSARTFKNVLYITYDSANSHTFYVGNPRSDLDCVTTYTKPVNFNIKNATAVTFGTALNSTRFTDDGLIQVINSSGVELTGLDTIVTAKVNTATTFEADETPVTKWIINNTSTEFKDALSFTDTVGVYDVAEGYTAIATKADDASVVVASAAPEDSQDVVLDLSSYGAGEYNVTIERNTNYTVTYFVSAEGNDSAAGTEEAPLLTVEGAINKANAEGYGKTDTVYVKVLGTTGVLWKTYAASLLPAYAFTLDISSATSGATVGAINEVVTSTMVELNGPTKLSNIKIANQSSNGYIGFGFYGNDVELGEGVTYASYYITYQLGVWNTGATANGGTYSKDQNVVFKSSDTRSLYLGNNYGAATFNGDINVTVDHASANPTIYFGCSNAKSTFNGLVNFNFKQYSSLTLTKGSSYAFGENSAVQIINSSGKEVTATTGELANITAPKYILTNNTGDADILSFTDAAGVYKVDEDTAAMYTVTATSEDGSTVYTAEDGILNIAVAGTYTITKERKSNLSVTYFVSAAGSDENNGKTTDKPFLTVNAAVNAAIAAGYSTGDTVTIKTIGSAAIASGLDTRERLALYNFKLVITANDTSVPTTISGYFSIGGVSEFSYVTFSGNFAFDGFSATFGKGAKLSSTNTTTGIGQSSNLVSMRGTGPINIKFSRLDRNNFHFSGTYYNSATYNNSITLEIDDYQPYYGDIVYGGFRFSDGNCTGKYYAPVNVKVNGGDKGLYFRSEPSKTTYGENFAFQLINASGKPLLKTGDTTTRDDSNKGTATSALDTMPEGSVYVLTNNTSNKDLITFTSTVGTYNVNGIDEEIYFVRATSVADASKYFDSNNGTLTVESGEYTLSVEKKSGMVANYYVSAAGSDEADGKTEATAVLTLGKAVELAIAKGYGAGDTVNFRIVGTDAVSYGSYGTGGGHPRYEFDAIIKSNTAGTKAKVNMNDQPIGGTTTFEWIETSNCSRLGFQNVTFDENSTLGDDYPAAGVYHSSLDSKAKTSNGFTQKLRGSFYSFDIRNNYGGVTHNGPIYIYAEKLTNFAGPNFNISNANSSKNTFNAGLNIRVESIDRNFGITATADTYAFGENGGIQVINASGKTLNNGLANIEGTTNKYYLINNTGEKKLIDFTATIGTFVVDADLTRYVVKAVSTDGTKTYTAADGKLVIAEPGDYNITKEKITGFNYTYYVDSSVAETGDGAVDAPFATVAEAIAAGNAEELIAGDTVTVKVVGETAATWGTAEAYTFLLKVVSNDTENISTVNATTVMTGAVHFDDIFVRGYKADNNPYRVSAGGYNVTFGSGVETDGWFSLQSSIKGATNANAQTFVLNNAFIGGLLLGNETQGYITYKSNVDVLINNASAAPEVTFLGYYGGNVTFNSNLNFNLKNAASISFGDITKTVDPESSAYANGIRSGVVSVQGAAQLLMPGATTISDESLANFKGLSSTYYIVRNNTGEELDFTATAGVYSIGGSGTVYVYKNGVQVAETDTGVINIADLGAGEYVLVKTREASVFEYTNADGATIADMITKAINNGAIEGDTLRITLTGTDAIEYGTPVAHLFNVQIISAESTPVSFVSQDILKGDTKFDGVKVSYPGGENTLWLGGHNVEMTAATTISGGYYIGLGAHNNNMTIDTQTVKFDCAVPTYLILAGDWANITRTGALNVTLGHATTKPIISFGFHGTNTYADVNINLGTTTETSFKYIGDGAHVFTGDIKVIGENQLKDTTYLDSLSANVYTVYNKTGVAGVLGFGEGAGEFTVAGEDVVRAIGAGTYVDSVDGVLTLTTKGHYYIGIPHIYDGEESTYADYIDYRTALNGNDALNNFAAKINAGEDVNVVYYGGSVTAGSGASVSDKTSWRGITSSWLQINAPNVNVTNVNSAIGGTGSHFGFYRLDEAVLANDPDLLFIEYSINDFYDNQDLWNIGENEAAMQLESIVRKVRTEAPECDIVIVLTTERSLINSLKESDTLHAQARGHYKIAEKYGIPTLRVGHALADTLSANWADNDYAEWYEYVTDIVHPTDKGYQIYAGVVKEFLANSLLGDKNDGALVKNHTVPTNIVSEEIWAGDPVFIQANEELSAESVALGGSEFAVASGRSYPYHTTTFRMSDPDAVLKFKFTGTELSILDDQYSNHYNGVNVKIDGGEETYVEFRNYKPTVLASGLDNVEHTAEVRIADVNAGGGHWVYGFFVRNEADNILKTAEEATYYVSAGGTESGLGTEADPVQTVAQAIALGNAAGLVGRDYVTVKVMGTEVTGGSFPAHTFNLTVESNDPAVKTKINVDSLANNVGGTLHYKNVALYMTSQWSTARIGHMNATFDSDVTFGGAGYNSIAFGTSNDGGGSKTIAGQTVVWNSPSDVYSFGLGNSSWSGITYTDDVNFIINSTGFDAPINLNTYYSGNASGSTKYNANLNVIIKNAKGVSFAQPNGAVFGGAIQIINSAGLNISSSSAVLADITAPKWIITNNTGNKDVIETTATAGVYTVNIDTGRYGILATSADGTKSITNDGTTLDLTSLGAGDYTITLTKDPETVTYYVETGATDGDGSLLKPFANVMEAVAAANANGYIAGDTVNVLGIGTEAIEWGTGIAYEFLLVVDSDSKLTVNNQTNMTGDVKFDNITVANAFRAYGYNVEITENTTYNSGITGNHQEQNVYEAQTIKIGNAYTGSLNIGNGNFGGNTWNEDANYIFTNANAYPTINFSTYYGGTNTFKKNFNVILKDAKGVSIGATTGTAGGNGSTYKSVVNGAVNMLIPADATISETSIANLYTLTNNVYYVENALGNAGTIDYVTGSAGQFVITADTSKYTLYLTDEEGNSTEIQGGNLQLPAAGKYTVSATRIAATATYYAQAGGTGDGSSAESPLGSVDAVIAKAIADDNNYSSITVKLMVLGTEALPWGVEAEGDLTKHNFTLVIDSETEGAQVGSGSSVHMGGNTEIDNVFLVINGTIDSYPTLGANGYDLTIGSGVTSGGSYWSVAGGRHRVGVTPADDQYITINAPVKNINVSNTMSASNWNKNAYIVYNAASGSPSFSFGSQWGKSTYNANVIIDIKAASGATFGTTAYEGGSNFGENAKIQVIDRVGLGLSTATAGLANIDSSKVWVIEDSTGELGTVTATGTVGTFAVETIDPELYVIKAIASTGGTSYAAENGILTIPTAGTYTIKVVRSTVSDTIYVSANGTANASGDIDDPFLTVADAIAAAVEFGYGAEDTITIKLIGTSVDTGAIPAYEFDLIVTSADANTKTTLNVTTNTLTNNEGGDVRFSNVTIAKTAQYTYVVLNDSNATFDSDVSFNFGYDTFLAVGTDNDGGAEKIVENGKDIIFNSTTPIVSLSNNRWANRIYTGDVNLVVNNASANARIRFNASYAGASNGNTIYNEKLNINIKDASAVSFNYGAGVIVNGGLQIINSSANEISIDDAAIAAITGDKWIINNKLGGENIAFTETAGEFTVNFDTANYYLLITYADGTEFKSSSTSLVLAAGEYTIEKVKIPKEASYELNAEGKENTYASLEEAILAANAAGYSEGDIVTFNLSGTTAIPWGQTLEGPTRLTAYEYNLIIQTIEGQDTKATINELNASNRSVTVRLSGPTEFKNVTINVNGDSGGYPTFGMGANDVIFNSDVSFVGGSWGFVTGQYANSFTSSEAMDLYIANSLTGIKIGNSYTGNTYGADVNITYNNANASPAFTFGTNSTEKTTFKKNVNFNLMAANGVSFAATGHAFAPGSAIQIINSTNVAVDSATGVLADLVDTESNAVPKYIITNKTGNPEAISFTETAGVYELDLGELKYDGYYAVITNNATEEVTLAKGDSVTLAAGEYTVTTARDPLAKEYTITEGTLADAVQTAIDEGYGYGDNITFKLGTLSEINVGTLPKYNFNLVIESEADTRLVMNESRSIANNEGAHTHFKNVEIYNEAKWSTINLNGSSATFDKDVVITTGGYCTLSFGTSADEAKQVVGDQKVVLDCVAPTYISLSSWNYASRTYEGDVTLVLNNSKTYTTVWFNAYYGGAVNGTTEYLGNININVKDAGSVNFDYFEGIAPGDSTFVQLLVDDNTTIDEEQVIELNEALSYGDIFYIIDKSFERGILEFTDEVGVYEVTGEYPATITNTKKYNYGNWEFVDCEPITYDEVDNKLTLTCDLEEGIIDSGIWEVRTTEYFEDFNDKTIEELGKDWKFSSDSDAVNVETQLVDGTVKLVSQHNLREIPALNKNINIKSKDQYISVDMKGDSFGYYNGFEIMARLGGAAVMECYQFHISGGFIRLQKLDGVTKSGGYYQATNDGFEMDGLWGRKPGTISAIVDGGANNTFTFNTDHTYRIGFSVVTDTDKSGNEIAYVRGIVLNLTTNEVMFDDTFKDTAPYQGEEFAILSPAGGSNVYIDNLYFSSEKFREGDEGMVAGDINGDGVYDVRDLVYTDENAANADLALIYKTDKNYNGTIDAADFTAIRLDILNDVEIGAEFNLSGASDAAADALREQILGSTSTLNGKVYTATTNGQVVLTHTITGDIWYVSSKATGTGNAGTKADPWTLEELQANTVLDNSYANSTYKDCKVQEGDAVLFERGSEFRTNNLLMDKSTSGLTTDAYSYMFMSEGTFYGAYGTGAKPKFIDSYMNYADATWTEVAGQENIYVIDAPEIIIDKEGSERTVNGKYATENSATNIVFDGGAKVGQRKHFPVSCTNDKIYSIYKDGQFTYDETTGKLYLYSANGNPGEIYESIEISRGIQAIQVNSHEGNVKVDNLAFHGFARGTIGSSYGTDSMWVTNCDIGYSGGITMGDVRGGNAVGGWCGGSDYKINHNWIYQTWDTAISPQGNQGRSYNGFEVIGNLLEYNNADIEIFDRGTAANVTTEATWEDCVWTDNIMRFTTLGWGSREADKIRGIQGVIRGSFEGSSSVEVNWSNNIIDTPGKEIIRLNNAMDTTVEGEGDSAVTTVNSIFRFGTGTSAMDNNTYYYNPYVRNTSLAVREYMTAVPADYEAEHGEKEATGRLAKTAADYYDAMRAFDLGANSKFFWGGVQVTQGN